MNVNVYLSGKFPESQNRLEAVAAALETRDGFFVVSRWLDEDSDGEPSQFDNAMFACRDLEDLQRTDLFVLDTTDASLTGGRETEFGYALAREIPCILVGPMRSVFHQLATEKFDDWENALTFFGVTDEGAIEAVVEYSLDKPTSLPTTPPMTCDPPPQQDDPTDYAKEPQPRRARSGVDIHSPYNAPKTGPFSTDWNAGRQ